MPPRKRSAASTDLLADLPFSPGQQSAELFATRKQHATSLALAGLASSPELAQWGNQLHSRVRRWQTAFTATAIVLAITLSALGYQTAVYHSGNSLTAPFVESFDKLSGNSQQALQQLVSHSSKLIPEGSSVRDSFDRLSGNTQRALYHLAQSGLSLPSFLPHKNSHEADSAALTGTDGLEVAKATVARLQAELSKAEKENALVTDLLQHSQHELSLSQARTHDLLASIAKVEDERSWLANQNARLRATLENNPEAKECVQQHSVVPGQEQTQQCPPCTASDDAKELYGTLGSQAWLLGAMAAANLLFMGFLYSPETVTRPLRALFRSSRPAKGALHQVSRKISDSSASCMTDSTVSRNTSCGQESLLDGLPQHDKQADTTPVVSLGPAASNGVVSPKQGASSKRASPSNSPSAKSSPNGLSGPSTPRTLESDSPESEADLQQQAQALKALAEQRDGLVNDLKSSRADLTRSEAKLAETLASMDSMDKTLAAQIERTEELQSQIQLSQDRVAEAEAAAVAAEEDLKSAEQKMAELTGSLDSARVNHDQVVAELQQQHADQTQALETRLAKVECDKASAEATLFEKTSEHATINQDLTDALSLRETADSLLEQTKADLRQQQQDLADAQASRDAATATLEQAEASAKQQSLDLADAVADKTEAEATVDQLLAAARRQAQELSDAVSAREFAEDALQQLLAEAEQQGQVMTDAITAQEAAEFALKEARAEADQQEQALTEAKESAEALLGQARSELKKQSQTLADLTTAQAAAQASLEQSSADAKQQQHELSEAKSARQSAEALVQKLQAEAKQHNQALADAIAAKDTAEATIKQLTADVKSKGQAVAQAKAEKQSAEDTVKQSHADIEQQAQSLADAVSARDSARAAVQQAAREAERQEKCLADARSSQGVLEQALQQAKAESSRLGSELQEAMTARSEAVKATAERNNEVHALRDQLERAQNYIQALQNQSGAGPEGRAAPEQGMRLPRPVRTSSLTGSLRSPRSPGGSSTSSTTSSRRNNDFQLADAEQRIRDLEAELARSKLEISMQSHTTPTGPCSKCRSMEVVHREVLSQVSVGHGFKSVWKVPGDYHNGTASPSANLSSQALGEAAELSSHAVDPTGDVTSHAVTADQALPSHAVELEEVPSFALRGELDSPKSSVGSARGQASPGVTPPLNLAQLSRLSPKLFSPAEALSGHRAARTPGVDIPSHPASGRDTSRTPLSSHAVPAGSTDSDSHVDLGGTPLSSHAVEHSSSSGSGPDEAVSPYI